MPRDWVPSNPRQLVAAIDLFITALNTTAGRAASKLTAEQFMLLQTLRDAADTAVTARDQFKGQLDAAQDLVDDAVADAAAQLRTMGKEAQGASTMTNEFRAQSGLTVRDTQPSPGVLHLVNDLVVIPRPSGSNFVDWTGPTGGGLLYLVYSRRDTETEWTLVGSTTRTEFLHVAAGAGVRRHYRVVSQRGTRVSEPGNVATAYA